MACVLLWSSAVKANDIQAYRKMDVTRERISHMWELREILLQIQTGFILVNASVVCAILESILGLKPSSVITDPSYFKLVTVSSLYPFTLIIVLLPLVLFVISLVVWALTSLPYSVEGFVETLNTFYQFFFLPCEAINVISKAEVSV